MRRPVFALAAVMAAGSALGSAGVAAADSAMVPGDTRTVVLAAPESWSAARQVDVTVGVLTQLENGCLEPEDDAGDDCDPDSAEVGLGELAEQMEATVTLGVGDSRCEPVIDPQVVDLLGKRTTRLTAAPLTTMSPGVDCVILALTFTNEDASDNVAQSDTMSFNLDLVARDYLDERDPNEVPGDGPGGGSVVPDGGQTPPRGGPPSTDGGASNDGDPAPDGEAPTDGRSTTDDTTTDRQVTVTDGGNGGGPDPAAAVDGTSPDARSGEPADEAGMPVVEGDVLDRLDAQVSVGDEGVAVQTRSADVSIRSQVLAWGSLFLGVVAVGWVGFWMILRRRRKEQAA